MGMDQDTGGCFHCIQDTPYFSTSVNPLNSTLPVILACDASPKGIDAVLFHRLVNGDERLIGCAS